MSLLLVTCNTESSRIILGQSNVPHTYSSTLFHIIFSTKERRAIIKQPDKLWAYVAGIARNLNCEALAVGGTENHLHALLRLPTNLAIAEVAQKVKANSSRWLKENGSWLGWQQGYGVFSVSASNMDAVRRYIQNQEEHHKRYSFEEEFMALLVKSGIKVERGEVFE